MSEKFFVIKDICKAFPGVVALDHASMTVEKGEIRALVGENGAGKSTLMKILNGNYHMDSGAIFIDGGEVRIANPVTAAHYGISIIFQELNLIDGLSVAENIFAGRLGQGGHLVNWKNIYSRARELLDRIGSKVDPKTEVGKLSIAGKQMVEIAKALSFDARIILMDEPSATLTKTELDIMFNIIRELKRKGIAVIYISHRLEEIFEICNSVTVMRDGCVIDTRPIADVNRDQIVEMMVGREISHTFPPRSCRIGEEVFRVENLRRKDGRAEVDLTLHRGEVLGIAGLVGSGRTEMARAMFGVDYISGGSFYVNGKKVAMGSPGAAKRNRLAFITEDRKAEGLIVDFTVKSNIVMANLKKILSRIFLSAAKENAVADQFIARINIKTPSRTQKVLNLSGGNQQKVVVSKWLNADADIIIMDEPTRGIDVGAKFEIYELINQLAADGKAVIMISSELPEVIGMSDRVLVMKNDGIVAELGKEEADAVNIMRHALS